VPSRASFSLRCLSVPPINGAGIIVGVVDYDIDFMHNNFRNLTRPTRLCICGTRVAATPLRPQASATEESSTRTRSTRPSALTIPTSIWFTPGGVSWHTCHGHRCWQRASHRQTGVAPAADLIFVHIYGGDVEGGVLWQLPHLAGSGGLYLTKAAELGKSAVVNLSLVLMADRMTVPRWQNKALTLC